MRFTLFSLLMLGVVLLSMAAPVHAGVLLGGWTMDDNAASNTVLDISGNGNDGSLVTATANVDTDTVSVAGVFGTALNLEDGVYADLTSHFAALKPVDNNYSVTLWVKNVKGVLNTSTTSTLFAWDTAGAIPPRIQLDIGRISAGNNRLGYFTSPANTASYGAVTTVADQWHHVAMTMGEDAGVVTSKFYLDGVEKLSTTGLLTVGMVPLLNQVHIGATDYSVGFQYANLPMDDVGLWAGTLSPAEIQNVMDNGIEVPEPSTICLLISASLLLPLYWRRRR